MPKPTPTKRRPILGQILPHAAKMKKAGYAIDAAQHAGERLAAYFRGFASKVGQRERSKAAEYRIRWPTKRHANADFEEAVRTIRRRSTWHEKLESAKILGELAEAGHRYEAAIPFLMGMIKKPDAPAMAAEHAIITLMKINGEEGKKALQEIVHRKDIFKKRNADSAKEKLQMIAAREQAMEQ